MKTLRATSRDKVQQDKYYDLQKLREIDIEQGRKRLHWTEVDGVMSLLVAKQLLDDSCESLKDISREVGAYNSMRSALGFMTKAINGIRNKISGEQLISISNNVNDCDIFVSARSAVDPKQMINVSRSDMQKVVNQACKGCDYSCSCNREESKKCELRAAMDRIPGVKAMSREHWNDQSRCPYMMFELEDE